MHLPHSLHVAINSYWESLIESGKTFHRGDIFCIKEIKETKNELHVTLHKTDYAHFLYTKKYKMQDQYNCRAIVANGLLITNDNYIILGQMNNQTASPGRIQFIAGGIDQSDLRGNKVDIFGSLIREANEEIGLDLNDHNLVLKVEPKYIVHWGSVALIYLIQLNMNSTEFQTAYEQFETYLDEKDIKPEFSSIVLLSADYKSVSEFLDKDDRPKLEFLGPVLKKEINIK